MPGKSILIYLLLLPVSVFAQVNFSVPDTLCVGDTVPITNLSRNATTYHWNFCSANLSYGPQGDNLGNVGNLNGPAFTALVKDQNGDYFAFITNHTDGTITRLIIGNNLLNPPSGTNLGSFAGIIPIHAQGIQVKYSNGKWYGFIVGGLTGESTLVRLDFGDSLNSIPTATDLGNPGNLLAYPIDLNMFEENGIWYGFTVNFDSNTVVRFTFKNGLDNPPTVDNLGNIGGLSQPCGIMPVYSDGHWYFYITNFNTHSLTRLDFGSSLANQPSGVNINNLLGLSYPFDLSIIRDCGKYFGFILNRYGQAIRLDFPSGVAGDPVVTNFGTIGGLSSPHGISDVFRAGDTIYFFIANSANSTISRLFYPTCDAPTLFTSSLRNPPPFSYRYDGNFNIQLILDRGLPTEEAICKNVLVFPKPVTSLGPDTTICMNSNLTLQPANSFISYKWSDGSTKSTFTTDSAGLVWVEAKDQYGCKATDSVNISVYPKTLDIGPDVTAKRGDWVTFSALGYKSQQWSTGANTPAITVNREGKYTVSVVDQHDCIQTDEVYIRYETYIPNFFTPNNDGLNDLLVIPFLKNYPDAVIKIYDRYGKLVASKKGSDMGDKGWDGNYNGAALPMDSYWYFIDLKDGSEIIKGYVTIKW